MASNAAMVARTIRVFRDQTLSPQAQSKVLAAIARRKRDELIASGDAPPSYTTFVDGVRDAREESVRPDGAIIYQFNVLGLAAAFGFTFLMARSPVDDGEYRASWLVIVNGKKWTTDLDDIPHGAEVMIVNPKPYARKIDAGHMRMRVPPGLIEAARQAIRARYPTLDVWRQFVDVPPSLGGGYVLRGRFRRGFRKAARSRARSDTQAGAIMTYPALVFSVRR